MIGDIDNNDIACNAMVSIIKTFSMYFVFAFGCWEHRCLKIIREING